MAGVPYGRQQAEARFVTHEPMGNVRSETTRARPIAPTRACRSCNRKRWGDWRVSTGAKTPQGKARVRFKRWWKGGAARSSA